MATKKTTTTKKATTTKKTTNKKENTSNTNTLAGIKSTMKSLPKLSAQQRSLAFDSYAKQLGKNVGDLTDEEKLMARYNARVQLANQQGAVSSLQGAEAAQRQHEEEVNRQNVAQNRINEQNAFDTTVQYDANGNRIERMSQGNQNLYNTQLAGQQQYAGLGQEALQNYANQVANDPYNVSNITGSGISADQLLGERNRIEGELYNRYATLGEPTLQKQLADFEEMAANKGWTPGSKVYEQQKALLQQEQQQTRESWQSKAVEQGLNELSELTGLSNQQINQQLDWYDKNRYGSLQEANALYGQSGQVNLGETGKYNQVNYGSNMDYMGAYNTQQQIKAGMENAKVGASATVGAAQAGASGQIGAASIYANQQAQQPMQDANAQLYMLNDPNYQKYINGGSSSGNTWSTIAGNLAAGVGQGLTTSLMS